LQEGLILEFVDPIVEVSENRKEAVHQRVNDPLEQQRRAFNRSLVLLIPVPHLNKAGDSSR
jgi:hypothetical protein